MRCQPACEPSGPLNLIDHAPVTPLEPIVFRAVVARSEGRGRRRVFQQMEMTTGTSRLENVRCRQSLALDGSKHDGRLMGNRDSHVCISIPAIMKLLCACMIAAAPPAAAIAEERDIGTPGSIAIAVSSPGKLPSARSSAGTSIANLWAEHIAEAAHRFSIPERWIRALMIVESGGDPHALSPAGAMGLMQIMPATWRELSARYLVGNNPYEPRANILAGTAYLREMYDRYGNVVAMLAAYNAGPSRYERYLAGAPLPAETIAYVAALAPSLRGERLYESGAAVVRLPDWHEAPLFVAREDGASIANPVLADRAPNEPHALAPATPEALADLQPKRLFVVRNIVGDQP